MTASEGGQDVAEACFQIRAAEPLLPSGRPAAETPAAGELTMTVPGLHNPVSIGKGVTYRIQVTNNSSKSYRKLSLTAGFPQGFVPNAMGTQGPGSTQFRVELQTGKVYFNPVFEVPPKQTLVYEVRGLARQPVQGQFHVELTSPDLPQPLVKDVSAEAVK